MRPVMIFPQIKLDQNDFVNLPTDCPQTFNFGPNVIVYWVAWCPNPSLSLLAVAVEDRVVLLNTGLGDKVNHQFSPFDFPI